MTDALLASRRVITTLTQAAGTPTWHTDMLILHPLYTEGELNAAELHAPWQSQGPDHTPIWNGHHAVIELHLVMSESVWLQEKSVLLAAGIQLGWMSGKDGLPRLASSPARRWTRPSVFDDMTQRIGAEVLEAWLQAQVKRALRDSVVFVMLEHYRIS